MLHFASSSSIPLAFASLIALALAPLAPVEPARALPPPTATLTSACTMTAATSTVSLSAGGSQFLMLHTTPAAAGVFPHLMGSITGTQPGLEFNGLHLSLNYDRYFRIAWGGQGPFLRVPTNGFDAQGDMLVEVRIPAGFNSTLAGRTLNHAFTVFNPIDLMPDCMSNAVSLTFVP